jgi:hypothetical protein
MSRLRPQQTLHPSDITWSTISWWNGCSHRNLKKITTRINYFFYHTRLGTDVGKKLETSIAFLQLESGLCTDFLSSSYTMYEHLVTPTLMKQIWRETETNGLHLTPATNITWTPALQGRYDMPIISLLHTYYSKKLATALNRCHLYFQFITLYDPITYDGKQIHPNFFHHKRLQSRQSNFYWVNFKNHPSRTYKHGMNSLQHSCHQLLLTISFVGNLPQSRITLQHIIEHLTMITST